MTVRFYTDDSKSLLADFISRIEQEEARGKIETWRPDKSGKYFTHKSAQWSQKAWFTPKHYKGQLNFALIKPKSSDIDRPTYSFYHGHLIETFLNHFPEQFSRAC